MVMCILLLNTVRTLSLIELHLAKYRYTLLPRVKYIFKSKSQSSVIIVNRVGVYREWINDLSQDVAEISLSFRMKVLGSVHCRLFLE